MKIIGPVIEKTDAFIISEIFNNSENSVVYIGKDDREIINIQKKLSWLLPKQKILIYKAWDQIPYDNISPSKEIQTSRIETLFYLNSHNDEKIILLTTLNGIIQKTLPKNEVQNNFITISKKSKLKIDKVLILLIKLGYDRTSLVRDKSEFAIRYLNGVVLSAQDDFKKLEMLDQIEMLVTIEKEIAEYRKKLIRDAWKNHQRSL